MNRRIRIARTAVCIAVTVLSIGAVSTDRAAAVTGNPATDPYFTFGVTLPKVHCNFYWANDSVQARGIWAETPGIRSSYDFMQVSWQPILWMAPRSYPTAFRRILDGPVLGGITGPNMTISNHPGFNINAPLAANYWRVSIVFRWYHNGQVIRERHYWAGNHITWHRPYQSVDYATFQSAGDSCQL